MLGVYAITVIVTICYRHDPKHLMWIWLLPVTLVCGGSAVVSVVLGTFLLKDNREKRDACGSFANECCVAVLATLLTTTVTLLLAVVLDP
jgi:ABC-type Fe3+ transport system permease subunit